MFNNICCSWNVTGFVVAVVVVLFLLLLLLLLLLVLVVLCFVYLAVPVKKFS